MKHCSEAQIGQIVKVLKGKDAGSFYVIIEIIDDKFVMIVDGAKRKFDQPKRKNIQHLELQPIVSSEVVHSLHESGRVTNAKLRHAVIANVESANLNAKKKGD